jgi:TRAP-type C4-dicarboxylate transport system permease small subunit
MKAFFTALFVAASLSAALAQGIEFETDWAKALDRAKSEKKPMLPVPDGIDYVPVIIAGALIVLFSIEHMVALLQGKVVEAVWD